MHANHEIRSSTPEDVLLIIPVQNLVLFPGVATGLAWTPAGGDILFVESSRIKGRGALLLTGQLGDVTKESAQAAVTLVKSQADRLGIDPAVLEGCDLYIHLPAGAIPKVGPSAGVVMPVGGITEKCVAAARAGLRTVILPARNRRDFDDIPETVRNRLEFVWAVTIADALERALEPPTASRAAA
jgi:ATP-dependent Lon protease